MAALDKTGRMVYAVGASLVIHALVLGALVTASVRTEPKDSGENAAETKASDEKSDKPAVETRESDVPETRKSDAVETRKSDAVETRKSEARKESEERKGRDERKETKTPPPQQKAPRVPAAPSQPERAKEHSTYIVRKGDSLTAIAAAHGCTLQDLKQLNQAALRRHNNLFVGQKLKVPKIPGETKKGR